VEEEVCCLNARGRDEAEEIKRLKKALAHITAGREILKKAAGYFADHDVPGAPCRGDWY